MYYYLNDMIPICLYEKKFKGISLKKSLTEFLNSEIFLKNLKRKNIRNHRRKISESMLNTEFMLKHGEKISTLIELYILEKKIIRNFDFSVTLSRFGVFNQPYDYKSISVSFKALSESKAIYQNDWIGKTKISLSLFLYKTRKWKKTYEILSSLKNDKLERKIKNRKDADSVNLLHILEIHRNITLYLKKEKLKKIRKSEFRKQSMIIIKIEKFLKNNISRNFFFKLSNLISLIKHEKVYASNIFYLVKVLKKFLFNDLDKIWSKMTIIDFLQFFNFNKGKYDLL